ncbi:MAG: FGGY family carbohydrate kinase [Bacteroidota bacterium]|nr:FGGY family carbohydrate kinase [Bacteroidota bacterium]
MRAKPVIAVIDVGKTNKKLFLFDQHYKIVYELSAHLIETVDEDGDACENIESLRSFVLDSLRFVFGKKEFDVKAINFSTYGASFVYIDDVGNPLTPLYNYLKPYPELLKKKFYETYGGEEKFSSQTASPVLGSLNSGMQLYRIKYEKPELFKQIKTALHLPQFLSFLISGKVCSDITSIGCHTNLWHFQKNDYHEWVQKEGIKPLLAPIVSCKEVSPSVLHDLKCLAGIGLHDSSASLIPYLMNFQEPFILISTGTWCISLNPFNNSPLTVYELEHDCLCYMQYHSTPVKASRLFAGHEHEEQVKRIAAHFNKDPVKYRSIEFSPETWSKLRSNDDFNLKKDSKKIIRESIFDTRELQDFLNDMEAYHQLIIDIISRQYVSTQLVLRDSNLKRIFIDGGFSTNAVYMNLFAAAFPDKEVFAASMPQATALGAALAIHNAWNKKSLPNDIIKLQYYSAPLAVKL